MFTAGSIEPDGRPELRDCHAEIGHPCKRYSSRVRDSDRSHNFSGLIISKLQHHAFPIPAKISTLSKLSRNALFLCTANSFNLGISESQSSAIFASTVRLCLAVLKCELSR